MRLKEVLRDIARYIGSIHQRKWFLGALVLLTIFWGILITFVVVTDPKFNENPPALGLRILVAAIGFLAVSLLTIAMPQVDGFEGQFPNLGTFFVNVFARLPYHCVLLLYNSMVWLRFRVIIIRRCRFAEKPCISGCKRSLGGLCVACERIASSSSLLVGSSWGLILPSENHKFLTVDELDKSAASCTLCSVLMDSIELGSQVRRSHAGWSSLNKKLTLKIQEKRGLEGGRKLRVQILGGGVTRSIALAVTEENIQHECDSQRETVSASCLKLAKRWIEECQSHPICTAEHPDLPKDFVPTRVLVLGPGNLDNVRLVETKDLPAGEEIEYAALSHCWGNRVSVRLLDQNIDDMKQSLRIDSLPRNFQDAIKIARSIGVLYLWIDSLCIVQDSREDWVKESARMGMLYANAVCMLSATASATADGGFSYDKKAPAKAPACVLRKEGEKSLVVRRSTQDEQSLLDNLFNENVEKAPLTTRGWTFQERILAKRVLHFCDGLVLFECNTIRASEYHTLGVSYPAKLGFQRDGTVRAAADIARIGQEDEPSIVQLQFSMGETHGAMHEMHRPGLPIEIWTAMTVPNPDYQSREEKLASFFEMAALMGMRGELQVLLNFRGTHYKEKIGFHLGWYEIVSRYSMRELTKDDDKLIALMGVAELVQLCTKRTIVAGIWEEALLFDLLWSTSQPAEKRSSCVVPTWSWASVHGRVETQLRRLFQELTGVIQDSRKPTPSLLGTAPDEWELEHHWTDNARVKPISRNTACILSAELRLEGYLFRLASRNINTRADLSRDEFQLSKGDFWYLPIFSFAKKNGEVKLELHGIVLRRENNSYERVGYFWIDDQALVAELRQSCSNSDKKDIFIL